MDVMKSIFDFIYDRYYRPHYRIVINTMVRQEVIWDKTKYNTYDNFIYSLDSKYFPHHHKNHFIVFGVLPKHVTEHRLRPIVNFEEKRG